MWHEGYGPKIGNSFGSVMTRLQRQLQKQVLKKQGSLTNRVICI